MEGAGQPGIPLRGEGHSPHEDQGIFKETLSQPQAGMTVHGNKTISGGCQISPRERA